MTYDRARDLPRLMPVWAETLADQSEAGCRTLIARIDACANRMRLAGLAGDWAYSLPQHRQLMLALDHERANLARLVAASKTKAKAKRRPRAA